MGVAVKVVGLIGQGIHQAVSLILLLKRRVQGNDLSVPFFFAVIVDKAVSDCPRGIGKESTPAFFVAQYGFVKGKHGDAFFVLPPVIRLVNGTGHLVPDKSEILLNQRVGSL